MKKSLLCVLSLIAMLAVPAFANQPLECHEPEWPEACDYQHEQKIVSSVTLTDAIVTDAIERAAQIADERHPFVMGVEPYAVASAHRAVLPERTNVVTVYRSWRPLPVARFNGNVTLHNTALYVEGFG